MKKSAILLGVLIGWTAYAVTSFLFPPLTIEFWRLARTDEVAFDVVGLDGQMSSQFLESERIHRSACPQVSFRILFAVGTSAGKCHAVVGLRRYDQATFSDYVKRLEAIDDQVTTHWMDMSTSTPASVVAAAIRQRNESSIAEWQRDFRAWRQKKINREVEPPVEGRKSP